MHGLWWPNDSELRMRLLMGELLEFRGKALQQVEKIVERQERIESFERNVADAACRFSSSRNWNMYKGEKVFRVPFGDEGFSLAPTACCVCRHIVGGHFPEKGFIFWGKDAGDLRVICTTCHRRWWNDYNEKSPA